ncbi:MAG: prolipoprotein diacylglyceryl transferase [Candidatus Eisenbacteria bacterium]
MRPILLELGPLQIHAYGFALALSFLLGSFWISSRGRRRGLREDDLSRLFFWVLASALIGSRIYYALQHPEDFAGDWLGIFRIWRGGLSQHGGILGAIVMAWIFVRSRGWSFREIADLAAPVIALGEGITRLGGCFLAGCCHGVPTEWACGVAYPEGSPAYHLWGAVHVHPSPLYLAAGNILLFLTLARLHPRLIGTGRLFALYLVGSSVIRFIVDFSRYYADGDRFTVLGLELTHSQWIGIPLTFLAIGLWLRPRRVRTPDGQTVLDRAPSEAGETSRDRGH